MAEESLETWSPYEKLANKVCSGLEGFWKKGGSSEKGPDEI